MGFYEAIKKIDENKENISITFIEGKNVGEKLLLSDGEEVFSTNSGIDWKEIIKTIPQGGKSQVLETEEGKIFVEYIHKKHSVVVCGAGHISIPIIKMCQLLDLPVTVIDDRLTFTNNARLAGANHVICEPFEEALRKIDGDKGTFFIIVTRGHRYDQICLENIIKKENVYIGMIGSRSRVAKVLRYLETEKGIPREKLDRVYTPIGLDIGAETPAEIAVAIMAEIIEVKNKGMEAASFTDEVLDGIIRDPYRDIPKAVVTIVSRKGSIPREVGTKMVVLKDGTMLGTIGGGCVEANIRQIALNCIDSGQCQLVKEDMTGRDAEEDGMVCGGIAELFVEPIGTDY